MINCNCKDCAYNNHEDHTCELETIWIEDALLGPMCSDYEETDDDRP